MKRPSPAMREAAEMLAIQALAFLAENPEDLTRFLGMTGIAAEQIRTAAGEEGFLAGVLEHMLADENLLIRFAESASVDPAEIARARGALGGRSERNAP